MTSDTAAPSATRTTRRAGTWLAAVGCAAGLGTFGVWLFCTDPALRRSVVFLAIGVTLAALIGLAALRRRSGGQQPFRTVAAEEFASGSMTASDNAGLPSQIPSRKPQLVRAAVGGLGLWTLVVGLVALALGAPERPDAIERIHAAGPKFAQAEVVSVSDSKRHDPSRGKSYYTSTAVVRLPGASGGTATVRPESPEPLRPADRVPVLHAPSSPEAGAVAGTESDLGHLVSGATISDPRRWFLLGAWALGAAVVAGVFTSKSVRTFRQQGAGSRAVRAGVSGPGTFRSDTDGTGRREEKRKCLLVTTDSGRSVHFLVDLAPEDVPAVVSGQGVWFCWDGNGRTAGNGQVPKTVPAALVADSGWVLHGTVPVAEGQALADSSVSLSKGGPGRSERELLLWDARAEWPRYVSGMTTGLCAVAALSAGLMTFDVADGWRWAVGVAAPFLAAAIAGSYLMDVRPQERPER